LCSWIFWYVLHGFVDVKEQSGDKISEGQVICSRNCLDNSSYRKSLGSRNISTSQQLSSPYFGVISVPSPQAA
jgi:hypothetical protein